MHKTLVGSSDRQAFQVTEACITLGISRSTFCRLAKNGDIRVVKVYGRTLVPAEEVGRLATCGSLAAPRPTTVRRKIGIPNQYNSFPEFFA
jgi:excisionase family DNA binding protein